MFRAASGQGLSRSGLLVLPAFGYSGRRCDGLPVAGVPAVVLVFFPSLPFPPFRDSLLLFLFFGVYSVGAFLGSVAVVVLLVVVWSSSFVACRYGLFLSVRK